MGKSWKIDDLDGQTTNYHLNWLITEHREEIRIMKRSRH